MSAPRVLQELGERTSEAVLGILRMYVADAAAAEVSVIAVDQDPFAAVEAPAVAGEAAYLDGVPGGNIVLLGTDGARRLAAAMTGSDPAQVEPGGEIDDDVLSAVGDAIGQLMAATAMATAELLGEDAPLGPVETRRLASAEDRSALWDHDGRAAVVGFSFCGESLHVVQLLPNAFMMRMAGQLEQDADDGGDHPFSHGLRDITVRVWAELGRTRMASGSAVDLPSGAIVELDRLVDDPVDVYVDGMRFATCRLLKTEDGGLAMRLETIHGLVPADGAAGGGEPDVPVAAIADDQPAAATPTGNDVDPAVEEAA